MKNTASGMHDPVISKPSKYIRIDNKILFIKDDYYEKVICKTGVCWLLRAAVIAVAGLLLAIISFYQSF